MEDWPESGSGWLGSVSALRVAGGQRCARPRPPHPCDAGPGDGREPFGGPGCFDSRSAADQRGESSPSGERWGMLRAGLGRPFRAIECLNAAIPRALPWATMYRPFRPSGAPQRNADALGGFPLRQRRAPIRPEGSAAGTRGRGVTAEALKGRPNQARGNAPGTRRGKYDSRSPEGASQGSTMDRPFRPCGAPRRNAKASQRQPALGPLAFCRRGPPEGRKTRFSMADHDAGFSSGAHKPRVLPSCAWRRGSAATAQAVSLPTRTSHNLRPSKTELP